MPSSSDDDPRSSRVQEPPPEVAAAACDPSRRLAKYVLLEQIGIGGMGQVYRAWDSALNRAVAVKVLRTDTSLDDFQRFEREAQTAAALSHPNIAAVYDVGEQGGRHYIAMQYIDGATLAGARLAPRRAAEHVRTIASALHAAHRAGIVHRDVKPGNLMTDRAGRIFIMDFGIARPIRGKSTITQDGIAVGTPSYMSPEQARGYDTAGSTDIYSLGATLYELLCGRPPYEAPTPIDTLTKVLSEPPTRLCAVNRSVPPELELVVGRCMEREPGKRYADAQALADDLDRFLRGEPVLARPPTMSTRVRLFLRRRRAAVPGAVAALVLGALLAVLLARSFSQRDRFARALAQANAHYAAGHYEQALALYHEAVALDARHALAVERLADCAKRVETARAAARNAEERVKRRERAAPDVEKGKERLDQAERDLYRRGADLEASRAKAAEAIACFDGALAACPDHAEALTYRARARLLRLDLDGAERDLDAAVEASPSHAAALAARGRLHARRWVELLVDSGGTVLEKGPVGERTTRTRARALADFEAAAKAGRAEDRHAFDALIRFAERNFQACLEACDRAIDANPTDEEIHKLKGDALYFGGGVDIYGRLPLEQAGTLRRAEEAYTRALELRVNYPEALAMRSAVHLALGRADLAQADLEAALAIDRRHFLATILTAKRASETRRLEEASELYARAIEVRPDSYFAHVNRGAVLTELQRTDEAIRDLDEAIRLNPDHVWAWQLKGGVLGRLQKYDEAEKVLTHALTLNANYATIWYNRGAVRLSLGRRADAVRDFEEAVRLNHPNADTLRQLIEKYRDE